MQINHLGTMTDDPARETDHADTPAGVGAVVPTTRNLPRGGSAVDRYGARVVRWPDGQVGYARARRSHLHGGSFGPYTILSAGLSAEECDRLAE